MRILWSLNSAFAPYNVFTNTSSYLASGAVYFILASKVVQGLITYKSMPADQLALANTEINLREIPEGQVSS